MLSIVLGLIAVSGPAQEPIDFQLGWKEKDKLTYVVRIAATFFKPNEDLTVSQVRMDETGEMVVTVVVASPKLLSVSTSPIEYSGEFMKPDPAGTAKLTRKGRLTAATGDGPHAMYLMMMVLPEKPVSVGDAFKIEQKMGDARLVLDGKFVSLNGNLAVLDMSGTMGDASGQGGLTVTMKTTFDIVRKLVVKSEMQMPQTRQIFGVRLKGFGDGGWAAS